MSSPAISVVICAYSNERVDRLVGAVQSVLRQERPVHDVIVVIDHNPGLLAEIESLFGSVRTIANQGAPGLSGSRNSGIRAATGDVVAFLDDDAEASVDWSRRLAARYDDPAVIGVGGAVLPVWPANRPGWFPEEFNWVVGCSYRGLPEHSTPVRNPIGCNMSFRREAFDAVGYFTEGVGREGSDAAGCEETEFCIRLRQANPKAVILYDPDITVRHYISEDRTKLAYFSRRCLAEGRSKTRLVKDLGAADGLSAERRYLVRVLPTGLLRGLRELVFRADPSGLGRAAGILAGVVFTASGYLQGKLIGGRS